MNKSIQNINDVNHLIKTISDEIQKGKIKLKTIFEIGTAKVGPLVVLAARRPPIASIFLLVVGAGVLAPIGVGAEGPGQDVRRQTGGPAAVALPRIADVCQPKYGLVDDVIESLKK